MNKLQAIPTRYKGYLFRSRLEARWAVFFDALGVPFRYEPEGYRFGSVFYLPNFWLPVQRVFVEIKPEAPNVQEETKARLLAVHSGHRVHLIFGDPWPGEHQVWTYGYSVREERCKVVQCGGQGRHILITNEAVCRLCSAPLSPGSPSILAAFSLAREARFNKL